MVRRSIVNTATCGFIHLPSGFLNWKWNSLKKHPMLFHIVHKNNQVIILGCKESFCDIIGQTSGSSFALTLKTFGRIMKLNSQGLMTFIWNQVQRRVKLAY